MEKQKEQPKFNAESELRSDLWDKMSLNDLWLQRVLLNNRMMFVQGLGKIGMYEQMARSMKFLDTLIEERTKKETNIADSVVIR